MGMLARFFTKSVGSKRKSAVRPIARVEPTPPTAATTVAETTVAAPIPREAATSPIGLLNNEALQNAEESEDWRSAVAGKPAIDAIDGGDGAFGRSGDNPIPVNGVRGALAYLSRLTVAGQEFVFFHRIGQRGPVGERGAVDVYELVSSNGRVWDLLYFDGAHPTRSRRAPDGYRLSDGLGAFIYGVDRTVAIFPEGLPSAIDETSRRLFGQPLAAPNMTEILARNSFARPQDHLRRLALLAQNTP